LRELYIDTLKVSLILLVIPLPLLQHPEREKHEGHHAVLRSTLESRLKTKKEQTVRHVDTRVTENAAK